MDAICFGIMESDAICSIKIDHKIFFHDCNFQSFSMSKKFSYKSIHHPGIPEGIYIGIQQVDSGVEEKADMKSYRDKERASGRKLVNQLVCDVIGQGEFQIFGESNQKPYGYLGDQPVQISISHSRGMIGAAVSRWSELGIDLEQTERHVYPGLEKRICHPDETELFRNHSILQVWTLKEAALKWCGSGLRTAMEKLFVKKLEKDLYKAEFPSGKVAKICNFKINHHWLSIAYDSKI